MTTQQPPSKDRVLKGLISFILRSDGQGQADIPTIRELLGALASWGGKGKDEIVQALCREIGVATAALLKEPLNQVIENRKLQITFELIPKSPSAKTSRRKPAKRA